MLLYYVFIIKNSRVEILLLLNKKNVEAVDLPFAFILLCHTQIKGVQWNPN